MAGTISLNVNLSATNGKFKSAFAPGAISITQANVGQDGGVITVNSSVEQNLAFGNLSTLGVVVGRNLDSSNYVTVGPTTSTGSAMYPFMRIEAGETFAFRLEPSKLWRWQANTAAVDVLIQAYED